MIQIALSILSATTAKAEEAVGMGSSAIFEEENPQHAILKGKILARKFR
jgi:hypothetical protein